MMNFLENPSVIARSETIQQSYKLVAETLKRFCTMLGRGFHSACDDIQPHRKLIVYAGDDHCPIKNGIEVIGFK